MFDPVTGVLDVLSLMIAVIATPLVLFKQFFFDIGNFFLFDVFQLGPYLPITF
ncbi:MAG: hypothetical protein H6817_10470 [Phycisphaerales bacterium]|nr:hypothetical protein [Phycisphaerales bacterium]